MILQSFMTEEFSQFATHMQLVFGFAFECFTAPMTIFGYTFSWFDLAVAFMCIGLVFLAVRRISDL